MSAPHAGRDDVLAVALVATAVSPVAVWHLLGWTWSVAIVVLAAAAAVIRRAVQRRRFARDFARFRRRRGQAALPAGRRELTR